MVFRQNKMQREPLMNQVHVRTFSSVSGTRTNVAVVCVRAFNEIIRDSMNVASWFSINSMCWFVDGILWLTVARQVVAL